MRSKPWNDKFMPLIFVHHFHLLIQKRWTHIKDIHWWFQDLLLSTLTKPYGSDMGIDMTQLSRIKSSRQICTSPVDWFDKDPKLTQHRRNRILNKCCWNILNTPFGKTWTLNSSYIKWKQNLWQCTLQMVILKYLYSRKEDVMAHKEGSTGRQGIGQCLSLSWPRTL